MLFEDENTPLLELHTEPPDPDWDIPEPEDGGVDKSGGGSRNDKRSSASTSSSYFKRNRFILIVTIEKSNTFKQIFEW